MTMEQLRRVHETQPFQPFTFHLADGRQFHVPHPEFAYIPPTNERTFFVSDTAGVLEIVDLLLVVSIELHDGKTAPNPSPERLHAPAYCAARRVAASTVAVIGPGGRKPTDAARNASS